MKLKRAIGIAILTYIASFIIGIFASLLTGFDMTSGEQPSGTMWAISIILSIIIIYFFTLWYLKGIRKISLKEGLYFGLTLFIIGWLMDLIVYLVVRSTGQTMDVAGYYASPLFWLSVVLIILTAAFAGWIKSKK